MTVTNSTSQPIWLGLASGAVGCSSNSDCASGATCLPAPTSTCTCGTNNGCGPAAQCNTSNNYCYWNPPSLTSDQVNLAAGKHTTICMPAAPSGSTTQWSGNLFARTGCNSQGQQCQTGECGNAPNQPCPTYTGGQPPASLVEMTLANPALSPLASDFYDVSMINGINVGVSIAPVAGTFSAQSGNPYSCGAAGATSQPGPLEPCTWKVVPTVNGTDESAFLRLVFPASFQGGTCPNGSQPNSLGYCACTADTDCASGSFCGLAMNASAAKFTQVCGSAVGWWSTAQICGPDPTFGAPFSCASTVTNPDKTTSTYTNFYACTQPTGAPNPEQHQSCYTSDAAAACCGCPTSQYASNKNWPTVFTPTGGSDNGCYNNDPSWVTVAQPWAAVFKLACPTAYSFQYDDPTSLFTCVGTAVSKPPSYQVTFFDLD